MGDGGFQSISLQRRVRCEPDFEGVHPPAAPANEQPRVSAFTSVCLANPQDVALVEIARARSGI